MFRKKQTSKTTQFQSQRAPKKQLTGNSFRRNTVVISRSQREIKEHQQSVTQRQIDRQRSVKRKMYQARIVIVLAIAVISVLYFRMQVDSVQISPEDGYSLADESRAEYISTVEEFVYSTTFNRQSWLIDIDSLRHTVMKDHPEVKGVNIVNHMPFTSDISLKLSFREPLFVWQDANDTVQFVDSEGVLFAHNFVRGIDKSQLVHIEDQSGVVLDVGSSVLTAPLVEFVGKMPSVLSSALPGKMKIEQVIIPKSIREVQVKFKELPYIIKLSSERSLQDQAGELKALDSFLRSEKITPSQYVDLRTPLKAFYK